MLAPKFHLALGVANLAAVLRAHPGQVVRMVGLKGRWLGHLRQASHPAMIATVALSYFLAVRLVTASSPLPSK